MSNDTFRISARRACLRVLVPSLAFAAPMLVFAGAAQAQGAPIGACSTPTNTATYSNCRGNAVTPGSTVTSPEVVRAAVAQTGGLISSRVSALSGGAGMPGRAFGPDQHIKVFALGNAGQKLETADPEAKNSEKNLGVQGLSAGAHKPRIGIWADAAWSRIIVDKPGSKFDGEVWSGALGVDYAFTDRLVAGIAGVYEDHNYDTSFNRGSLDGSGITAAPYVVFKLDKNFSVDASAGYSWLEYDNTRRDPLTNAVISGATDANRWFGAANLNAGTAIDQWRLGGRVGTQYAREKKDAFTENNNVRNAEQTTSVGDIQFGVRLGYVFRVLDGLEPYVSALGRYAYQDGGSGDKTDAVLGVGTSLRAGPATLGIQGTTVEGRDNTKQYSGGVNLRVEF
jgi:Autotransporter beta-domain